MNVKAVHSTEVAVIPPKPPTVIERAMSVFVGVPSEESLRELAKGSATITAITNQAGYDQCHSSRMALKNARLEIVRTGEAGREDAVQTSKAIIARQKTLIAITLGEECRLEVIQKAWDDRIAAEKEAKIQAEIARAARLQKRIEELRGCQTLSPSSGSQLILEHIADLEGIQADESFEEFQQQAIEAKTTALVRLNGILGAAVAHEAEQAKIIAERAELAKLRAEQADRDRIAAAAQAKADADAKMERERIASENAEKNRIERERIAKDEADAKAIRDAEKAENDRINADIRASNEAEEKRLADERGKLAADQEALRVANLPKPKPRKAPSAADIVQVIARHYGVTEKVALGWLLKIELHEAKAS